MKKLLVGAPLSLCLALTVSAWPGAQAPDPVFAFANVNVIPMDRETLLTDQTVIVRGDRIVEIGPAARVKVPDAAMRIDGRGRYLMPALAEMHAHVPGGNAPDAAIERVLFLYAANGIGTIRGMLGHPRHLTLRDRIAKGELWAPRLYTSGPSFNGNTAATIEVATEMVLDQKAAGYDFLKIHPGVPRAVMDAVAATAKKAGIPFAGHVPADVGLHHALELKPLTVDHLDGYIEALARQGAPASQWFGVNLMDYVDESRIPQIVRDTKAAGTWMVTTEILLEHTTSDEDPEAMAKWPEFRYADPKQVAQWIATKKKMMADVAPASRARFIQVHRTLIKALNDAGVPFLLGSDAPQMWNVPGFSVHRELKALVASGLSPYQALTAGTRNVAVFFGTLETTGTVASGKRADLILLDANPLADVANSSKIAGVMLAGRWMARGDIDTRLEAGH